MCGTCFDTHMAIAKLFTSVRKGVDNVIGLVSMYIYYIPPPLTVHFPMTRNVRYQPILHTLYYTLHTEHAYCLSYRFLNDVFITTVIEMVEMVEILDGRLGKRSVERVRYVINNLLHLVIVKYGVISLVLCFPLAFGSWQYRHYSWNISSYFTLTRVISLIYTVQFFFVIWRTRDLIYPKL